MSVFWMDVRDFLVREHKLSLPAAERFVGVLAKPQTRDRNWHVYHPRFVKFITWYRRRYTK